MVKKTPCTSWRGCLLGAGLLASNTGWNFIGQFPAVIAKLVFDGIEQLFVMLTQIHLRQKVER